MGEYSILSSYPIFFLIFIFFYILFEMNRFCGIVALFLLFCFATNLVNAKGGNEDKLKSIAGKIDDQIEKIFKTVKNNKESFQDLEAKLDKIEGKIERN